MTFPCVIVSSPTPRGRENRLGPAEPGLNEQHLAEPFNFWLMRVAEDADIWMFTLQERPSFFRHLSAFVQNMANSDAKAGQLDHGLGWESTLLVPIDIAVNGRATRHSDVTEGS